MNDAVTTATTATAPVVMYTKSWCPYCERARALLKSKGVAFQEIDIEAQPGQLEDMIGRCAQYTVPQIFIDGEHVTTLRGNYDELAAAFQHLDADPGRELVGSHHHSVFGADRRH